MSVSSAAIDASGAFLDKYGKRGTAPQPSIPFRIDDAPQAAVSFAVILDDPDAVAVAGKVWDHWLIANLARTEVLAGESSSATDFVQGKNGGGTTGYAGMAPPDRPHTYVLTVYALDTRLDLEAGFSRGALEAAMQGHVLTQVSVKGTYAN